MFANSRIAIAGLFVAAALPFLPGTATAQDGGCNVPPQVAGSSLALFGSQHGDDMPATDVRLIARFDDSQNFSYLVMGGASDWRHGTYSYSSPSQGVATINATDESGADYTVDLQCRTDRTGDYQSTSPDTGTGGASATYRFVNFE